MQHAINTSNGNVPSNDALNNCMVPHTKIRIAWILAQNRVALNRKLLKDKCSSLHKHRLK